MDGLKEQSWASLGWPVAPIILFLAFVMNQYVPGFYALSDEHAYMLSAKTLATRGTLALRTESPLQLVGQNYVETAPGVYYAKHPPGTAVLLALGYAVGGPDGPPVVNVMLGVLALVGVYLLGRELSSPLGGAVAAGMLAVHPLFVLYAVRPMSHVADVCFSAWAMWALWRWYRHGGKACAATLALLVAAAVCVRYTNVVLLLPAGALIGIRAWPREKRRTVAVETAVLAAVLLLTLLPLAAFHTTAFGAPFRTGYAFTRESAAFSVSALSNHAPTFLRWAMMPGFGLCAMLPLAALGVVILLRRAGDKAALLALWALPVFLLYMAYYWIPPMSSSLYLRLFLGGYAAAMLLVTVAAMGLVGGSRWGRVTLVAAAAIIAGINLAMPNVWQEFTIGGDMVTATRDTARLVRTNLPRDSAIFADRGSGYYLDYADDFFLWDPAVFDAGTFRRSTELPAAGPLVFDPRRADELRRLLPPGAVPDPSFLELQVRTQLAAGRRVAVLCPQENLPVWRERFPEQVRMSPLAQNALNWWLVELTLAK